MTDPAMSATAASVTTAFALAESSSSSPSGSWSFAWLASAAAAGDVASRSAIISRTWSRNSWQILSRFPRLLALPGRSGASPPCRAGLQGGAPGAARTTSSAVSGAGTPAPVSVGDSSARSGSLGDGSCRGSSTTAAGSLASSAGAEVGSGDVSGVDAARAAAADSTAGGEDFTRACALADVGTEGAQGLAVGRGGVPEPASGLNATGDVLGDFISGAVAGHSSCESPRGRVSDAITGCTCGRGRRTTLAISVPGAPPGAPGSAVPPMAVRSAWSASFVVTSSSSDRRQRRSNSSARHCVRTSSRFAGALFSEPLPGGSFAMSLARASTVEATVLRWQSSWYACRAASSDLLASASSFPRESWRILSDRSSWRRASFSRSSSAKRASLSSAQASERCRAARSSRRSASRSRQASVRRVAWKSCGISSPEGGGRPGEPRLAEGSEE
mmetsp:Transcript_84779/g.182843  ORF Transcript_84779/g.182843 Transcript_84779/m.182843 type:complete len:445 (-) Transcript_84779:304-1638(-)